MPQFFPGPQKLVECPQRGKLKPYITTSGFLFRKVKEVIAKIVGLTLEPGLAVKVDADFCQGAAISFECFGRSVSLDCEIAKEFIA